MNHGLGPIRLGSRSHLHQPGKFEVRGNLSSSSSRLPGSGEVLCPWPTGPVLESRRLPLLLGLKAHMLLSETLAQSYNIMNNDIYTPPANTVDQLLQMDPGEYLGMLTVAQEDRAPCPWKSYSD